VRVWFVVALLLSLLHPAWAETPAERGKYLASFSGCDHCHTPGYFLGKRI
jgi:cytochrome c551/c552